MGLIARGMGGGLVALVGVICLAPTADAEELELSVKLPEKGGKRILFGVDGGRTSLSVLEITKRYRSATTYLYPRERVKLTTKPELDVDLGKQGFVDARFVASKEGPDKPSSITCVSPRDTPGHLVGRISFRGIPGVKPVRKRRVKAKLTDYTRRPCREPAPAKASLVALSVCNPDETLLYFGLRSDSERADDAFHFAYQGERVSKKLVIFRDAFRFEPPTSLTLAPDLSTATTSPGYPFSGSGEYTNQALGGDFAVKFIDVKKPVPISPGVARLKALKSNGGAPVPPGCGFEDPDELLAPFAP